MYIKNIDHIVLTVGDVEATVRFYTDVLGMRAETQGGRHALHFGGQKINLHSRPAEFLPAAACPVAGSADICLVAQGPMSDIVRHVRRFVPIEEGPVPRHGANGPMTSVYVRDPDGNLVEICVYD